MTHFIKGVEPENLEHFKENPLDHIGLVGVLVEGHLGRGMEFDDLMSHGIIGLLKACQRYDKKFGVKFTTYSRYWIEQEINRAFRSDLPFIQVPEYMYTRHNKVGRGEIELDQRSQDNLDAARKIWNMTTLRIFQSDYDDDGAFSGKVFIPECPNSEVTEYPDDYEPLRKALTNLSVMEQRILIMFFFKGMRINQIIEVTGLTKDNVIKVKSRAIQKLRKRFGVVEV